MEQCVLMNGGGLGWQDCTTRKVPQSVLQPAPMSAPRFPAVTREKAVLDAAPRDVDPMLVNEHLHPFRGQTVRYRVAVAIMTAGQTGWGEQARVDVMSLDWPQPKHQKTANKRDLFGRHGTHPDHRVGPRPSTPRALKAVRGVASSRLSSVYASSALSSTLR
jgi:hypothetical protein